MSAKKEKGLSWRKSEAKLVNDAFYFTGLNGKDTVLYKKKFVHCQLEVYKGYILLNTEHAVGQRLDYEDMIGVSHEISKNPDDIHSNLLIHYYPLLKGKRVKQTIQIRINDSGETDDKRSCNEEVTERIKNYIRKNLRDKESLRYLVVLNPKSGTGLSSTLYKQFKIMLLQANINHTVLKTEYRGHAEKIGESHDLANYDAVISISGDGLFHELINGLMKRDIDIPVGLIPAGSGNGLVVSAASEANQLNDIVLFSMFKMVKYNPRMLDLMKFESGENTKYCMLSVMVGLIADIDLESEKLRSFGDLRFDIYAVLNIIAKRKYKINLQLFDQDDKSISMETDNYWTLCFGVAPFINRKTNMFPKCVANAGMHMIELKYKLSRAGLVQLWGHVEAGTHTNVENDSLKHTKIHKVKVTSDETITLSVDGESFKTDNFILTDLPKRLRSLI